MCSGRQNEPGSARHWCGGFGRNSAHPQGVLSPLRLLGVCGSLRAGSGNLRLLHALQTLAPKGMTLQIYPALTVLPLFNPDIEGPDYDLARSPAAVRNWRAALSACDAVLIACPEYGHSLPGALKNAIDWVIGTGELNEKVVGITADVGHPNKGKKGLAALLVTLEAVDAKVFWREALVRGMAREDQIASLFNALKNVALGPSAVESIVVDG